MLVFLTCTTKTVQKPGVIGCKFLQVQNNPKAENVI